MTPSSINLKACQVVESAHNVLLSEERRGNETLLGVESQISAARAGIATLDAEGAQNSHEIELSNAAAARLKLQTDDAKGHLERLKRERQSGEYVRMRETRDLDNARVTAAQTESMCAAIDTENRKRLGDIERAREVVMRVEMELARLGMQVPAANNDRRFAEQENAKLQQRLDQTKASVAEVEGALSKGETISEELAHDLKVHFAERDRKSHLYDEFVAKESRTAGELRDASASRDRWAREVAVVRARVVDARARASERNLAMQELDRKLQLDAAAAAEWGELYERAKWDKKRATTVIQGARQLLIELRGKIRVLEDEVAVLRSEFARVDAASAKQKVELSAAEKQRDIAKEAARRGKLEFEALARQLDRQGAECDRLNSSLRGLESAIGHEQTMFVSRSDECADRHRLLLDKQDTLCLLHEQFRRHEAVMRTGEASLRDREEELSVLRLALRDFERRVEIMQRRLPVLRAYEADAEELRLQLAADEEANAEAARRLEDPRTKQRRRQLVGRDLSARELDAKIHICEDMANQREQLLWERQIVLRDLEGQLASLREVEAQRVPAAGEAAARARAEAAHSRRARLAALSELSVYQARQMELRQAKEQTRKDLDDGRQRSARGEVFDAQSARRLRTFAYDLRRTAPVDDDDEEPPRPGRIHFDAYPTADGLSRPYGAFPVFQPPAAPGYARHYRPEGPVRIEF
jgi:chromosome segregation ATPase